VGVTGFVGQERVQCRLLWISWRWFSQKVLPKRQHYIQDYYNPNDDSRENFISHFQSVFLRSI